MNTICLTKTIKTKNRKKAGRISLEIDSKIKMPFLAHILPPFREEINLLRLTCLKKERANLTIEKEKIVLKVKKNLKMLMNKTHKFNHHGKFHDLDPSFKIHNFRLSNKTQGLNLIYQTKEISFQGLQYHQPKVYFSLL